MKNLNVFIKIQIFGIGGVPEEWASSDRGQGPAGGAARYSARRAAAASPSPCRSGSPAASP